MNTTPIYQIDAFTNEIFKGNPAAVMPLEAWRSEQQLQAIAQENNLSETAFVVPQPETDEADFQIRWFTPTTEVPLCGHATLAAAWVIFNKLDWSADIVRFSSKSGPLAVVRQPDGWLELDFPNLAFEHRPTPALITEALGEAPATAFYVPNDTNYMVVLDNENAVIETTPDLRTLAQLGNQGLIVTAPGSSSGCDFVSRYFAPGAGIDEDPVTGSIHSVLTPYWAKKLGKNTLHARQLSSRGGELRCELRGERVAIAGQAAFYMAGTVFI